MATYNQTINGKNNEKKDVDASSATIDFSEQAVASGESVLVFNLPENSIVVDAGFYVKTGVTGATATGKITVGTTDVVAPVAFGGTSDVLKGGAVTKVHTGTGAEAVVTIGTANATAGVVEVYVEYIEYTESNGELTNY